MWVPGSLLAPCRQGQPRTPKPETLVLKPDIPPLKAPPKAPPKAPLNPSLNPQVRLDDRPVMAVGILGNPLLGNVQDKEVDKALAAGHTELHAKVTGEPKTSLFGEYRPVNDDKVKALSEEDQKTITDTKGVAKKNALKTVALFPIGMFAAYLLLLLYFRMRGGYKAVSLTEGTPPANGH